MNFEQIWQRASLIKSAVTPTESNYLFSIANSLGRKKVFVEIGSHVGRSSVILGMVAKENDCDLTCIDNFIDCAPDGGKSKPVFLENMKVNDIKYTLMEMNSDDAAKIYNKKIDLLFIDGNHLYDDPVYGGVRNDCKYWIPKIRNDGYVLFHDYKSSWEGVKRAVDETDLETITLADSMIIMQKRGFLCT